MIFSAPGRFAPLTKTRQVNRAAEAAAKLAESLLHANRRGIDVGVSRGTTILIECVQTRIVVLEEAAAMQVVGSVLGDHLNLSAAVSAILRGEGARKDAYLLD